MAWIYRRCRKQEKSHLADQVAFAWWAVKDSNLGDAAAHSRCRPTRCCAPRGPLSPTPTSPRLRRAPWLKGAILQPAPRQRRH